LIKIAQEYIPILESTGADLCEVYIQGAGDEDEDIRVKLILVKSDDDWGISIKRFDATGQFLTELDSGWLRRKTVYVHEA
jgi:hypothetical protein